MELHVALNLNLNLIRNKINAKQNLEIQKITKIRVFDSRLLSKGKQAL